jgi:hypothetical protein
MYIKNARDAIYDYDHNRGDTNENEIVDNIVTITAIRKVNKQEGNYATTNTC